MSSIHEALGSSSPWGWIHLVNGAIFSLKILFTAIFFSCFYQGYLKFAKQDH
jgi:hypothetical protein